MSILCVLVLDQTDVLSRAVGTAQVAGISSRPLQTLQVQAAAEDVLNRLLERLSKVAVEVGIDDGVHCGVEVADPKEDVDDDLGTVLLADLAAD